MTVGDDPTAPRCGRARPCNIARLRCGGARPDCATALIVSVVIGIVPFGCRFKSCRGLFLSLILVRLALVSRRNGNAPEGKTTRYSPAECIGITSGTVAGYPDKKHVSTSYVERSNLTLRMGCRRFTRLTNGFSKKVENHAHAVALHMMFYNFGRIHKTLRVTPAMQAGVADHVWSLEEIAALAV